MENLKVGIAREDITPEVGIPMDGFVAKRRYSKGVHDAIQAKAIVLGNGRKKVAIVSCDLCWLNNKMVNKTKDLIKKQTDVNDIILAVTHTHSGPAILHLLVTPTKKSVEYVKELPNRIAGVVRKACEDMKEAEIGAIKGKVNGIARNRCILDGTIDPELNIIYIRTLADDLRAILINYSCHPVVLGRKNRYISADFPGYCTATVEKNLGKNSVALFLNGACGDANPVSCKGHYCNGTFRDVEQIGSKLAKEALRIISKVKCVSEFDINILTKKIKFQSTNPIFEREIEVKILTLNDIFLIGIPGELSVQTGLEIKRDSNAKHVIISCYTNGYEGYIPAQEAYRRGCYEAGLLCWLPEGAGEKIRDYIVNIIEQLHKNKAKGEKS